MVENVEVQGNYETMKRPKMRIILARSGNFKQLMDKANAVKKENEAAFNALYPATKQ